MNQNGPHFKNENDLSNAEFLYLKSNWKKKLTNRHNQKNSSNQMTNQKDQILMIFLNSQFYVNQNDWGHSAGGCFAKKTSKNLCPFIFELHFKRRAGRR